MMANIYGFTTAAMLHGGGMIWRTGVLTASNRDEAMGKALAAAREYYPTPQYHSHQVDVIEVSKEWMREVLKD